MVSTQSGLRREIPFEGSNPPPVAMTDTNNLQQLQNHIAEMERRHEEKMRKLKVDHEWPKACIRRPRDDELFAQTLPEHTQEESHP